MTDTINNAGTIEISPEVIASIASVAATDVDGIAGFRSGIVDSITGKIGGIIGGMLVIKKDTIGVIIASVKANFQVNSKLPATIGKNIGKNVGPNPIR